MHTRDDVKAGVVERLADVQIEATVEATGTLAYRAEDAESSWAAKRFSLSGLAEAPW
ncbi:MAG: hypothetical protein H0V49_02675 [Nocardioidaceae bacterium]|nr:hypothetical protein [Nocardioidaceae bacterium]